MNKFRWEYFIVILSLTVLGCGFLYSHHVRTQNFKATVPTQRTVAKPESKPNPPTRQELLALTNAERAKAGVPPLVEDPLLNESAQLKADDMEKNKYYGHVRAGKHGYTYIADVGAKCIDVSENITADTTAKGAVSDWMGSSQHKTAMLNSKYESTGFAVSNGPGYKYIVQHFCDVY